MQWEINYEIIERFLKKRKRKTVIHFANETEPGRNWEGTDRMWCVSESEGVNAPRRQQGLPESS